MPATSAWDRPRRPTTTAPASEGVAMSDLSKLIADTSATLARIASEHAPAVFASSLAAEDKVSNDPILKSKLDIGIFSLEPGRRHKETLAMVDKVKQHYGYDIALYKPQT